MKREVITPKRAEQYLEMNQINRSPSERAVEEYADAMTRGLWNFGDDTAPVGSIVFNGDGTLLDGGHRLAAVMKAGKPQTFMVVRGMPTQSALLIDRGRRKSFPDLVRMWCQSNKRTVPSYINELCSGLSILAWLTRKPNSHDNSRHRLSPVDQLGYFTKYGHKLHPYCERAGAHRALMSVGALAAIWYLCAQRDSREADAFFHKLGTGEDINHGEPVGVLRNRLITDRAIPGMQARTGDNIERVIRAWNATRAGKRWTRMEPNHGDFPVIQ